MNLINEYIKTKQNKFNNKLISNTITEA